MAMVRFVRPWKARSKTTTPARPVAARAILTAFSTASAPELRRIDFVSEPPGQSSSSRRQSSVDAANTMLPIFANHVLWRPKVREVIGTLMEARDRERLREELNHGVRLANSLGLDVSDVRLPAG